MSNFVDNTLTDAGAALLSEVLLGAKLQPTKIVMGSGFIPSGQTSKTLTNVVTPEVTLAITKKVRVDATHVEVGGVYNNQDITEAFYFRELALYCKAVKDDGTVLPEIMYSYGNAGNSADLMVPYTSGAAIEKQIDLITYVGNDTNVDLTISSGTYITMADLQDALKALKAGSGIPPNDMQAFTAESTESGINLTFTGPKNSYLYGYAAADTLACVPAGVMIRYKEGGYPEDIEDGALVGDFSINPVAPESTEKEVIGLTFGNTYYFTAFPFSTEGVYNKSQAAANRASCVWSGSKGTINVYVQAYEGFEGVIGEYTITLVDQAASGGQNITQTASGTGVTQIGNLEEGKTYVVTLSDTSTLMADPSEPITIVAGNSYNVTLTYRMKYGTISVDVDTANDFAALGDYNITLVAQEDDYENVVKAANGKGVTVFDDLIDGRKYKVRLGDTPNFLPPADSDVVTVVGGGNVDVDMIFAAGMGSVNVTVSTNPSGMSIGSYTISLVPTGGGSTLSKSRSGTGTVSFTNVPIGTYNVTGSNISHYSFSGGSVSVTGGQTSSHSVEYAYNAVAFSQTPWDEVSELSERGVASQFWSVGDARNIQLTTGETLTIEIIDFNHDDKTSGGKAGITLACKNLMADARMMNSSYTNAGGFTGSAMYSWMSTALYNNLPSDLKAVVKQVNKKTSAGEQSTTINTNAMYLFLLAEIEVFGSTTYSVSGEGSRYARFTDKSSRIKYLGNGSGSARWWWLRSPYRNDSSNFCGVSSNGNASGSIADISNGVCFGFCV